MYKHYILIFAILYCPLSNYFCQCKQSSQDNSNKGHAAHKFDNFHHPQHDKYSEEMANDAESHYDHEHSHNSHHDHSKMNENSDHKAEAHAHSSHFDDDHTHHHHHHKVIKDNLNAPINMNICIYSMLSTLLISIAPIFIIMCLPNLATKSSSASSYLRILLGFAAGGLLGDAFLHLIPHSLLEYSASISSTLDPETREEELEKMYNLVGIRVLSGVLAFLCVDKIMRIVKFEHALDHKHESHAHLFNDVMVKEKAEDLVSFSNNSDDQSTSGLRSRRKLNENVSNHLDIVDKKIKGDHSSAYSKSDENNDYDYTTHDIGLKTAAYLNLVADFAHNFTDGLAISASFIAGSSVGILATTTILLHEVPHEIGDYAILIQSGCSKKKAILLQFLTAVGALTGTVLGLASKHYFHSFMSTSWILPFTAGGFIYIAAVTILPELLSKEEDKEGSRSLIRCLQEILALIVGIGLMVVLIYYE
ncbi:unnamed protein product [Gordionus sp. m RMFG-2023]|uniref:zinc transporter Slc39a7-like isoform X1 n=1 Tax=Gordionus sp. m RMFG-2023 TaxID=3053472 RepID=UPI0030E3EF91